MLPEDILEDKHVQTPHASIPAVSSTLQTSQLVTAPGWEPPAALQLPTGTPGQAVCALHWELQPCDARKLAH